MVAAVTRLMLRVPGEAAEALGVSVDHFDKHIRHDLRLVRSGRLVLVPVRELERWAERNAARILEDAWTTGPQTGPHRP